MTHARCLDDDCPCFLDGERSTLDRLGDLLAEAFEKLGSIQADFDRVASEHIRNASKP